MKRWLLAACLCLVTLPAAAQEEGEDAHARESRRHDRFISVVFENDSIASGTDRNYTNGVRLTYHDTNANIPSVVKKVVDWLPMFDINKTSSIFYSLGQNLYTPTDITKAAQVAGERPWASFLYGSVGMNTTKDNHMDEIEMTLGMIGPASMGEQVQKAIHKHVTNSPEPRGWGNQLDNEAGVILSWQRRWPTALVIDGGGLSFLLSPYFGGSVGNIYTYANTGVGFRIGSERSTWTDTPLRVRPALAGTGYFDIPKDKWDWHIFGGLEGRAVARNIFLDGNTFGNSYSVDKKPFVWDANIGLGLTYDRIRISYTLVYRAREFETQDKGDVFGALSVGYRF